jgi:polar amino acid transport system substrate-binding protein
VFLAGAGRIEAQDTCGGTYTVGPGESLSGIANELYEDAGRWSVIYQTNIAAIGGSPDRIRQGQTLSMPCIGGLPRGLPGAEPVTRDTAVAAEAAPDVTRAAASPAADPLSASFQPPPPSDITILTGSDFWPFTHEDMENGGLLAEIVTTAMAEVAPGDSSLYWVDDWGAHLDPLLTHQRFDMGFPWSRPDCDGEQVTHFLCENFLFSQLLFEMLNLVFVDAANPMPFDSDADMAGRTLCRPEGSSTHDLDRGGRNWVRDGHVQLLWAASPAQCMEWLRDGIVEGVVLNEFLGRDAIRQIGAEGRIVAAGRPVSIEGYHVVVSKNHPQADVLLERVNRGLDALRDSGAYQEIIDRHMSLVWASL